MNRRQRRAAGERRATPVIVAGDGIIAAALDHRYEARPSAELPPKKPGVHRWIAAGGWVLSDEAAKGANDPDVMKFLDNENLMYIGIACWDCERALGDISYGSWCNGEGADER